MKNIFMKICAFFFKRFASLNQRYDNLRDSTRFYTFLCISVIPYIITDIISWFKGYGIANTIAFIWVLILLVIRIWWIDGNLKEWLPVKKENDFVDMTVTTEKY